MAKSPFNKKELDHFKDILIEKKAVFLKEIQEQREETSHEIDDTGDLADLATELLEKEMNLTLTETERESLEEIDEALERINDKTYGICIDTGKPISKARLNAVPWTKRSLEAQEKYDKMMKKKRHR